MNASRFGVGALTHLPMTGLTVSTANREIYFHGPIIIIWDNEMR